MIANGGTFPGLSGPGWPISNPAYRLPDPIGLPLTSSLAERVGVMVDDDDPGPNGCPVKMRVPGHGWVACDGLARHAPRTLHRVTILFRGPGECETYPPPG